ncbi:MAG: hypothetical protein CSA49_02490 [Gammaproteobacteria bacterium]|nr:MAG: hypothetical protein CSA49_02490 [Gammaproteobacteria bacterium]
MTLIAILISYFAERESWIPGLIRNRRWASAYLAAYERIGLGGRVHPALAYGFYVLIPMFFAWYLTVVLHGWVFAIAEFVLGTFLLCSILMPRRLHSEFQPFLKRWQTQEWQAAYEHAAGLFHFSKTISTGDLLTQTMTYYLIRMNQYLFSPILWYVLFGAAGLVLYVLTFVIAQHEESNQRANSPWKSLAAEFMHALEGVSARVIAMSIALLFINSKALAVAVRPFRVADREAEIVLKLSIKMAMDFKELPDNKEQMASEGIRRMHMIQDLCNNILVLWLLVIAFFTLLGWAL